MECVLSAEEVLQDALKMDYESVIVFGLRDDAIFTRHSRNMGFLQLIGALEVAKWELWEKEASA